MSAKPCCIRLSLPALLFALGSTVSLAAAAPAAESTSRDNADPHAIPDDVAAILPWFPADTETLIVARDVELSSNAYGPKRQRQSELSEEQRQQLLQRTVVWCTESIALGRLRTLGGGSFFLKSGKYAKEFANGRGQLVVYGGREYEGVSAFGTFRWHGASVVEFADDARADVARFMQAIRKDAVKTRHIHSREVFCFPTEDEMESFVKLKPWQGVYVTLLNPNVVLCATSDVYLDEMLARIDSQPKDRALPAGLREWSYVDTSASVWGLRQIPTDKDQKLGGVVWLMQPGDRPVLEVIYLPTAGADVRPLAERWFTQISRGGKRTTAAEAEDHIRELPDGAMQVSYELSQVGRSTVYPYFHLYHLQGLLGTW